MPKAETNNRILAVLGDASAFLTMLAMIPYELGPAAEYLPPNVKAWTVGIGVFATFGLRIIKRIVEPIAPPNAEPLSNAFDHARRP
jgi:hypothetical protein